MRLRPHHLYCFYFMADDIIDDGLRGAKYTETVQSVKRFLQSEHTSSQQTVEVTEGGDSVCAECSHFDGQVCIHPDGGDIGVRKWDKRVLDDFGLHYGQVVTQEELQSLVKRKSPLNFCQAKCGKYKNKKCSFS